jgi:hypothetical protein
LDPVVIGATVVTLPQRGEDAMVLGVGLPVDNGDNGGEELNDAERCEKLDCECDMECVDNG